MSLGRRARDRMVPTSKIIIWGAGRHALVVADILQSAGAYEIGGFLDDADPRRHGQPFAGATVLGGREQLPLLRARGVSEVILAFGDGAARMRLGPLVKDQGFSLNIAINTRSLMARGVTIGAGTVIAPGAVLNTRVPVGGNRIIKTAATGAHDWIIYEGT